MSEQNRQVQIGDSSMDRAVDLASEAADRMESLLTARKR